MENAPNGIDTYQRLGILLERHLHVILVGAHEPRPCAVVRKPRGRVLRDEAGARLHELAELLHALCAAAS